MKQLLVLVDFSTASRNAAEYAAIIAGATGSSLHLLHLYRNLIPVTVGPEPWTITRSSRIVALEILIAEEAKFIEGKYSVRTKGSLRQALTGKSVVDAIKEMNADLFVIGLRQERDYPVWGNRLFKKLRQINLPVLCVPGEYRFAALKNVVLAIDFERALTNEQFAPLYNIIKSFGAFLRVMHIQEKGAGIDSSQLEAKLKLGYTLAGVTYLYDKIENNDTVQGIKEYVESHPADLLVMVAQHPGLDLRVYDTVHIPAMFDKVNIPLLVLSNC